MQPGAAVSLMGEGAPKPAAKDDLGALKGKLDQAVTDGLLTQEEANAKYKTALDAAARGGSEAASTGGRGSSAGGTVRFGRSGSSGCGCGRW